MTNEHDWPNTAPPVTVEHEDGTLTHQGVRYVPAPVWRSIEDDPPPCESVVLLRKGSIVAPGILYIGRWYFWEGELDTDEYSDVFARLNCWPDGHNPNEWMPLHKPAKAQP